MPQQAAACHFRFASEIGFQNHTVIGFTGANVIQRFIDVRHREELNLWRNIRTRGESQQRTQLAW